MNSYTLTSEETEQYDDDNRALYTDLKARFGRVDGSAGTEYATQHTTVYHPDGFIVDVFAGRLADA